MADFDFKKVVLKLQKEGVEFDFSPKYKDINEIEIPEEEKIQFYVRSHNNFNLKIVKIVNNKISNYQLRLMFAFMLNKPMDYFSDCQ